MERISDCIFAFFFHHVFVLFVFQYVFVVVLCCVFCSIVIVVPAGTESL